MAAPPAALTGAISSADQPYGLPDDLLTGIWRVESGSTYPNPYVNAEGYGGLFGTPNTTAKGAPYNNFDLIASTADQASLAASILAADIQNAGGDIGRGLSSYSGGGYSSVPGETTFGTLPISITPGAASSPNTPARLGDTGGLASGQVGGTPDQSPLQTSAPASQATPAPGCDRSGASFSGCFCGVSGGTTWYEPWTWYKAPANLFTQTVPCLAEWFYRWLQRLGLVAAGAVLVLGGLYLVARDAGAVAPVGV